LVKGGWEGFFVLFSFLILVGTNASGLGNLILSSLSLEGTVVSKYYFE
jgi:hypothetical protein